MDNLHTLIENYLEYCNMQKRLDEKTLKAYRIDLKQFAVQLFSQDITQITPKTLEDYIAKLHQQYSPKTAKTTYQKRNALRDVAVAELLFATGMRISELCSLKCNDINLYDRTILIYGKGDKERIIQIGNDDVIHILEEYPSCTVS